MTHTLTPDARIWERYRTPSQLILRGACFLVVSIDEELGLLLLNTFPDIQQMSTPFYPHPPTIVGLVVPRALNVSCLYCFLTNLPRGVS